MSVRSSELLHDEPNLEPIHRSRTGRWNHQNLLVGGQMTPSGHHPGRIAAQFLASRQ